MKLALWAIACLVIFISAFAFYGWAGMTDQVLEITPARLEQLKALKPELNFDPDSRIFYTGDPNPVERAAGNLAFGQMIDTLVSGLPKNPSKAFVLHQFELALAPMSYADTEDRERAAHHCEKVMDILGIESSDGLLNNWMYGPLLGHELNRKNDKHA